MEASLFYKGFWIRKGTVHLKTVNYPSETVISFLSPVLKFSKKSILKIGKQSEAQEDSGSGV